MSPMLRGEAQPLPSRELAALRSAMGRHYDEKVVPTGAGPYLVVRVPEAEPDFLRDVEALVDVLPYRDMRGYRGVLLLGDRTHIGVSAEMVRTLFEGRRQAEMEWVHHHREKIDLGGFAIDRIPSDPQRRLRAVFRVAADRVEDMDDAAFDALADLLPEVKRTAPGAVRPDHAYLVSDGDHVTLEGGPFFTELEQRRRARAKADAARRDEAAHRRRMELEERHEVVLYQLQRIMAERGESLDDTLAAGSRSRSGSPSVTAPSSDRPVDRSTDRPAGRPTGAGAMPPIDVLRKTSRPAAGAVPPAPAAPSSSSPPTVSPPAPPAPTPLSEAERDPRFAHVDRHREAFAILRHGLQGAGYRTKERVMVREVPVALAAARPEGYPSRVLVTFHRNLDESTARELLVTSRGTGAELVLAVAESVDDGVDRVVLATNLKVIAPEAVGAVRFQ